MSVDSDDEQPSTSWNLGFLEPPADAAELLRHRFRSKVGGRPAWLNPVDLPPADALRSRATGQPLHFLLQVYCPLDAGDSTFHRMLYLFIPLEADKVAAPGAVRVLRCQLPRENPFYAPVPSRERLPRPAESAGEDPWRVAECERCMAEGRPPPQPQGRHLFPEWRLVTEPEQEPEAHPATVMEVPEAGPDQIPAAELSPDVEAAIAATTSEEQKHFAGFAARVSWDPEQVLRYACGEGTEPLWPSPAPLPSAADIPPCPHCAGPRRFEFQVLPQLLNHLGIDDERADAIDWGTIAVFTCAASCDAPPYCEEVAWVQP